MNNASIKSGRKVANKNGRTGTILNGYSMLDGKWVDVEVTTNRGIEVWAVADMQNEGLAVAIFRNGQAVNK